MAVKGKKGLVVARAGRRLLVLLTAVAVSAVAPLGTAHAGDGSAQLGLPFATGQTWNVLPSLSTGGLHTSGFAGSNTRLSSLDFAGGDGHVDAAGDGTVHFIRCPSHGVNAHFVMIDHANGWHTSYYHITNEQVKDGQSVARGTWLGDIGTATPCGGTASGAHVHFTLWQYTGAFTFAAGANLDAALTGVDLGGWTISYRSSAPKQTCFTRVSDNLAHCVTGKTGTSLFNDGTSGSGISTGLYHFVYFVASDGTLRTEHWTGASWQQDNFGVAVKAGTSPSAYLGANGTHFVYFVASDGTLRTEHWTGASWQQDNFGVAVATGTSPSAYLG